MNETAKKKKKVCMANEIRKNQPKKRGILEPPLYVNELTTSKKSSETDGSFVGKMYRNEGKRGF